MSRRGETELMVGQPVLFGPMDRAGIIRLARRTKAGVTQKHNMGSPYEYLIESGGEAKWIASRKVTKVDRSNPDQMTRWLDAR